MRRPRSILASICRTSPTCRDGCRARRRISRSICRLAIARCRSISRCRRDCWSTRCSTNALKYAFVGRAGGQIKLICKLEGGLVTVVVADDGIGLGEGQEWPSPPQARRADPADAQRECAEREVQRREHSRAGQLVHAGISMPAGQAGRTGLAPRHFGAHLVSPFISHVTGRDLCRIVNGLH